MCVCQLTHFWNFETPLYLGSRRIPNVAILDVVIPNEIVGEVDGGSTKTNPLLPLTDRPMSNLKKENIRPNVEKTVCTKVL